MENYLIKFETYGLKNIKEKISVSFNKETIKLMDLSNKKIKVIFGLNGAGKSALFNSIKFYKKIIYKSNFLLNDNDVELIDKLINKEINEFFFKIYFLNVKKDKKTLYSHEILINKKENEYIINYEKLNIIKGQTINSEETKTIYTVENGVLNYYFEDDINRVIKEKTLNLLSKGSLISMFLTRQLHDALYDEINNNAKYENDANDNDENILLHILPIIECIKMIRVYLDGDDDFENTGNLNIRSNNSNMKDIIHINISSFEDKILKTEYENYIKQLNKQFQFIKIFKHNLKSINPVIKEDNEYLRIRKEFDYSTYCVDSEYESTGIKKLMKLFNYIESAINGNIVFIDEMDANINGVFLDKLLEFFMEEGKGTLCFTSHNFDPMNVLKKYTGSLLFLGETGKLVTLPKNGNSNPINFYKEGMVLDSPFNFESYDFSKIFSSEE